MHTIQNCTELLQCTILDIDKGAVFHTVILLIHTIRGKDLLQLINREIVGIKINFQQITFNADTHGDIDTLLDLQLFKFICSKYLTGIAKLLQPLIQKFIHGILRMLDIGNAVHCIDSGHVTGKDKPCRNFIIEISGGGQGTCAESVVFLISIAVHQACGNHIVLGHIDIQTAFQRKRCKGRNIHTSQRNIPACIHNDIIIKGGHEFTA